MLFNSFPFIFVFLPVTVAGFFLSALVSRRLAAVWLAGASLAFYAYWSPWALLILLGSIGCNYWLGQRLLPAADCADRARRRWLWAAVIANLALLGVFKYANFFIGTTNALAGAWSGYQLRTVNVVLPIGISFYTFTQIAFLVDCWKGKVREANPLHYLLFVTYFPHLIAGPVLHHGQMMPQFARPSPYRPQARLITIGLCVFAIGLAKKVVVADQLSGYADTLFGAVADGTRPMFAMSWLGSLAYTFQLYFDFSGYSDMAIGLSLVFGIRMPFNFDSPLRATSLIDFWRRWHMSLGAFLRDYVYIPLGGNRGGQARRSLNVLATMTLCGLWHGASWTFVAWGALHGVMLGVNQAWRRLAGSTGTPSSRVGAVAGWALTFTCVCVAFTLFRAPTFAIALQIIAGMLGLNGIALPRQIGGAGAWQGHQFTAYAEYAPLVPGGAGGPIIIALAFLIAIGLPNVNALVESSASVASHTAPRLWLALGVASGLLLLIALGMMDRPSPFLYFQF